MDSSQVSEPPALDELRGLRLGRCARRILLLAPWPTDAPRVLAPERGGRSAAESYRRALRRLAAAQLVELSWKTETVQTKGSTQSTGFRWDPEAGVYREVPQGKVPVERSVDKRAVKLTPLGATLVDRVRPELENGKRIRWSSIVDVSTD